jgi:hypothetical protein
MNKTPIPRDVETCVTDRKSVIKAIDSEVEYAKSFVLPERQYYRTHTLGEFILMLNQYAAQAQQKWTHHADGEQFPESLHEVRKIAALAFRCMEQHGAPVRKISLKHKKQNDS